MQGRFLSQGVLTCLGSGEYMKDYSRVMLESGIKGIYWEPQTWNPKNIVGI